MTSPLIDESIFNSAFAKTIGHEGGFVDDKSDPGGATQHGVSLRYLRQQKVIDGDLDGDGDIDRDDIRLIDLKEARFIYYHDFWLKNGYNHILSGELAAKVFDLSVNMGPASANKLFQMSINYVAGRAVCILDGKCGPKTVAEANKRSPKLILDALRIFAKDHYLMLINRNPVFEKYRKGWLKRAAS